MFKSNDVKTSITEYLQLITLLVQTGVPVKYKVYKSWGRHRLKLTLPDDKIIIISVEGIDVGAVDRILDQLVNQCAEGEF